MSKAVAYILFTLLFSCSGADVKITNITALKDGRYEVFTRYRDSRTGCAPYNVYYERCDTVRRDGVTEVKKRQIEAAERAYEEFK